MLSVRSTLRWRIALIMIRLVRLELLRHGRVARLDFDAATALARAARLRHHAKLAVSTHCDALVGKF